MIYEVLGLLTLGLRSLVSQGIWSADCYGFSSRLTWVLVCVGLGLFLVEKGWDCNLFRPGRYPDVYEAFVDNGLIISFLMGISSLMSLRDPFRMPMKKK